MSAEFRPDLVVRRPEPDRGIVTRAHQLTLAHETPIETYIRQQWEVAIAAVRVALDAWRSIWPVEADFFAEADELRVVSQTSETLGDVYAGLDSLARRIQGQLLYDALRGELSPAELDDLERAHATE